MAVALFCIAFLLFIISTTLFHNGCKISLSVKPDYEHDRFDVQDLKKAILSLAISYVFLVLSAIFCILFVIKVTWQ